MNELQNIAKDPLEPLPGSSPIHPWMELILCIAGSFATVYFAGIGTLAMVYGAWRLFRPQEGRGIWAILGCLAPVLVLCFVSWLDYGTLVLPCALCALAIAKLLPEHASVTNVCLTVLLMGLALVGADALFAHSMGYNIVSYSQAIIDEVRAQTTASLQGTGTSITAMASIDQVMDIIRMAWPFGYLVQASFIVAFGFLGLALSRRMKYAQAYAAFTACDIPLWAVVLLIIGVVCTVFGSSDSQISYIMSCIGVNTLLVCRVLFFIQGLACMLGLMDKHNLGGFSRVAILVLALFAELWFIALSVFGLVDVWANFRKLGRSRSQAAQDTSELGK